VPGIAEDGLGQAELGDLAEIMTMTRSAMNWTTLRSWLMKK
jgi:hypothetical protein